jgi:regulatory protein
MAGREKTDPWVVALRLLTRRDHSKAELKKRLVEKGAGPEQITEILHRCEELGYLDDLRYAAGRARTLMGLGRAVGHKILIDLRQRGISSELAEQALAQARDEYNDQQVLEDLLERRFPQFDYRTASDNERRRVIHFLQRRGFLLDRIMAQLTQKGC